ncbi:helix-turn-helix domain-containing protein [Actinospica robiniae]|uniref:helix-turn-helix domain-containing protein n=1 Tax=Actinospica robiniae TaxID=304901 RepID=UPI000429AC6D|nr:helix-turn-helix domain-containing protein [Actinospica robiniae]
MHSPANTPKLADAASLPPVLGLRASAAWLGISPSTAYRLVEADQFPVPVHRIGTSLRVPTTALLAYLGITAPASAPAMHAAAAGAAAGDAAAAGAGAVTGRTRTAGEPPRPGLRPVGRASVDGPRAL